MSGLITKEEFLESVNAAAMIYEQEAAERQRANAEREARLAEIETQLKPSVFSRIKLEQTLAKYSDITRKLTGKTLQELASSKDSIRSDAFNFILSVITQHEKIERTAFVDEKRIIHPMYPEPLVTLLHDLADGKKVNLDDASKIVSESLLPGRSVDTHDVVAELLNRPKLKVELATVTAQVDELVAEKQSLLSVSRPSFSTCFRHRDSIFIDKMKTELSKLVRRGDESRPQMILGRLLNGYYKPVDVQPLFLEFLDHRDLGIFTKAVELTCLKPGYVPLRPTMTPPSMMSAAAPPVVSAQAPALPQAPASGVAPAAPSLPARPVTPVADVVEASATRHADDNKGNKRCVIS